MCPRMDFLQKLLTFVRNTDFLNKIKDLIKYSDDYSAAMRTMTFLHFVIDIGSKEPYWDQLAHSVTLQFPWLGTKGSSWAFPTTGQEQMRKKKYIAGHILLKNLPESPRRIESRLDHAEASNTQRFWKQQASDLTTNIYVLADFRKVWREVGIVP